MILSVTLNPCVDHALFIDTLKVGDRNRVRKTCRDAGGKGANVSRVIAELGAETIATGLLGGGPGDYVAGVLTRQGVSHCFVPIAGVTRTNFSVEDESDSPPTTFNEEGPTISAEELDKLVDCVRELLPKVSWLVMGGSIPPGVPDDIYQRLGQMARDAGKKCVIDADGPSFYHGLQACPDFIKPNAKEASRLLNRPIETETQAVEAVKELYMRLKKNAPDPIAVISRGEAGAVMACRDGVFTGASPEVEVNSTIGSGDSLIGGMLWALEQGKPLEEAFRWGLAAGAATATTDGSEIARRPVILDLFPKAKARRIG